MGLFLAHREAVVAILVTFFLHHVGELTNLVRIFRVFQSNAAKKVGISPDEVAQVEKVEAAVAQEVANDLQKPQ